MYAASSFTVQRLSVSPATMAGLRCLYHLGCWLTLRWWAFPAPLPGFHANVQNDNSSAITMAPPPFQMVHQFWRVTRLPPRSLGLLRNALPDRQFHLISDSTIDLRGRLAFLFCSIILRSQRPRGERYSSDRTMIITA